MPLKSEEDLKKDIKERKKALDMLGGMGNADREGHEMKPEMMPMKPTPTPTSAAKPTPPANIQDDPSLPYGERVRRAKERGKFATENM